MTQLTKNKSTTTAMELGGEAPPAYKTVVPKVDRRKAIQWDGTFDKALEIARMLGDPAEIRIEGADYSGEKVASIGYCRVPTRTDPLGQKTKVISVPYNHWVTVDYYRQITVVPPEDFWIDWEEDEA